MNTSTNYLDTSTADAADYFSEEDMKQTLYHYRPFSTSGPLKAPGARSTDNRRRLSAFYVPSIKSQQLGSDLALGIFIPVLQREM